MPAFAGTTTLALVQTFSLVITRTTRVSTDNEVIDCRNDVRKQPDGTRGTLERTNTNAAPIAGLAKRASEYPVFVGLLSTGRHRCL